MLKCNRYFRLIRCVAITEMLILKRPVKEHTFNSLCIDSCTGSGYLLLPESDPTLLTQYFFVAGRARVGLTSNFFPGGWFRVVFFTLASRVQVAPSVQTLSDRRGWGGRDCTFWQLKTQIHKFSGGTPYYSEEGNVPPRPPPEFNTGWSYF